MHGSIPRNSVRQCACAVCGKSFIPRYAGRKRLFCSSRCRSEARRRRHFVSPGYPSSAVTQNAGNSSTNSAACKGENRGRASRFAVPLDLLGGRFRWPGTPKLTAKVANAIVRAEVGGVHYSPISEEPGR
jgi:hypothetical protein